MIHILVIGILLVMEGIEAVEVNPFELAVQTLLHHFSDWYVDALFAEFYLGSVYASCPCDRLLNFWLWSMDIHPFKLSDDLAVVRLHVPIFSYIIYGMFLGFCLMGLTNRVRSCPVYAYGFYSIIVKFTVMHCCWICFVAFVVII